MNITDDLMLGTKLHSHKLTNLIEPMQRHFGVTQMAYVNVDKDLNLVNLNTHVPWMERCMEQSYFVDDPHLVAPNKIESGFAICSLYSDESYCNGMLHDANENFGICHTLTYVVKNSDGFRSYVFGTSKDNIRMQNKMLNNIDFIKNFTDYLEKQIQPYVEDLRLKQLNLYDLKGKFANSQIGMVSETIPAKDRVSFYKDIGFIKKDSLFSPLSQQEIKCIKLYLDGKTAKETAEILCVSRRTVESYMENIKTKLNCRFKKELFNRIDELKCIGIL